MHVLIAAAVYTWTQISVPGTIVDAVWGLNDKGQAPIFLDDERDGIWQDGHFTPLPPTSQSIFVGASGINDEGLITGGAVAPDLAHEIGFLLDGTTYVFFSRPGWDNTAPRAIANSGLVTGFSFNDDGTTAGFVYDPKTGKFTDATPAGSTFTIVQGMNRAGRIAGSGHDASGTYGFIWQQAAAVDHKATVLPFFARISVADGETRLRGINDAGTVTGFTNANGTTVGFIGSDACGYQLLVPPGGDAAGASTGCEGLNNLNQVVCSVTAADGTGANYLGSPRGGDNSRDCERH